MTEIITTTESTIISLIGRPNVGKSSLYNALMRTAHKSITFDSPGVTRDRHYGVVDFDEFSDKRACQAVLVDTGGFYPKEVDIEGENSKRKNEIGRVFFNIMAEQAKVAIDESDLVLFVVDAREGILPFDKDISDYIRANKKKFWLLVNKVDSDSQQNPESEFYALGLDSEDMFVVSAAHGKGLATLRERLQLECLSNTETPIEGDSFASKRGIVPKQDVIGSVSIIGAPNAGKSTLLNKLVGSARALVSDIPGTTVDPIEGYFDLYFEPEENSVSVATNEVVSEEVEENEKQVLEEILEDLPAELQEDVLQETKHPTLPPLSGWKTLRLVDTAGIRKQKAIDGFVEEQSVFRALRCIAESDIVIYMVDAEKGICHQDRRLIDIALEKGKSLIICLNKVDLMKEQFDGNRIKKEWLEEMQSQVVWLDYCDIIPISAKYNRHIKALLLSIKKTILVRRNKIPTGALNRFAKIIFEKHRIILNGSRGQHLKVKYVSMLKSAPPTFLFFVNKAKGVPESYRKYVQNSLRKEFNLYNTPVHLMFRTGKEERD